MFKDTIKESIFTSLMLLMNKKPYEKITIIDITRKAGVSRMSFYRHYSSKDDILLDAMNSVIAEFEESIAEDTDFTNFSDKYINMLVNNKALLSCIVKAGSDDRFADMVLNYHKSLYEKKLDKNEISETDMIKICFFTGGVHSVIKHWAETDFETDPAIMLECFRELQYIANPSETAMSN